MYTLYIQVRKNDDAMLIVAGFDDGVVRLLKLGNFTKMDLYGRKDKSGSGDLGLINALKPHCGRVTCLAVDNACQLLASAVHSTFSVITLYGNSPPSTIQHQSSIAYRR